jgi:hypothetical protein
VGDENVDKTGVGQECGRKEGSKYKYEREQGMKIRKKKLFPFNFNGPFTLFVT